MYNFAGFIGGSNFFAVGMDYSSYSSPATTHSQSSAMGNGLPTQMIKELQRVVPADIKTQEQMKVEG